jgi:serine/threonine-protein kinase
MLDRLREIERELGVSPIPTRTAQAARFPTEIDDADIEQPTGGHTMVLPEEATSVLADTSFATSTAETAEERDNAAVLRGRSLRRRRRGGWALLVTLLLAVGAAATGWWWGSGPGSLIAVPQVQGLTLEEARDALAAEELVGEEVRENVLDVPAGEVIRTEPGPGARVERETVVTLVTSAGPAPAELGQLAGLSVDEVRGLLDDSVILTEEEDAGQFSEEAEGTVLGVSVTPAAGGDPVDCSTGCSVHQGDSARLTVSLGTLPDVSGMTEQEARDTLSEVGVDVAVASQEHSDTVAEGSVIYLLERDEGGNWRPGDTVRVVTSLGPQLFEVPDVVGLTRDEAVAALEGAGFVVTGIGFPWNIAMNDLTEVRSQSVEAGSMHVAGTEVSLEIDLRGNGD